MNFYGYHRVSTREQKEDRGVAGIEKFCRERGYNLQKVYIDKASGKDFNRARYVVLKEDVLRNGDTLIVFELDRLGRTKKEIARELLYFKENNIRVMFLDIPTSTMELADNDLSKVIVDTVNNILIEVLSMIAEAERERSRKRCDEGREAMKAKGEWHKYGRKRNMSLETFKGHYKRVQEGEIGQTPLRKELGLKESTFYRYVREIGRGKDNDCH